MTDIVPPAPAPAPLPLAWDRDRLVVTDPAVLAKLARKRLSASTAKAMDGCPARYVGEKLIGGEENPFDAAPLGTSAHTVMEKLMQLPAGQRTKAMAATFLPEMADEIDFAALESDYPAEVLRSKWMADVISKYEGLWDIEDPNAVLVRRTEMSIANVEIDGVPFNGFIDRCDIVTSEDGIGVKVVDYKGLALDTPLPTPTGWTTMGEVRKGDLILGANGAPTKVVSKSEIHNRPCYAVTFDDGSTVVCDNVHLWNVAVLAESDSADDLTVKTVDADALYGMFLGLDTDFDPERLVIASPDPVELPEAVLGVDPWVMGMETVESGESIRTGTYLRSSREQRIELLTGLMDTAGAYNAQRRIASFTTGNSDLADQVRELLATLGVASTLAVKSSAGRTAHRIEFTPAGFNPFADSAKAKTVEAALRRATTPVRTIAAVAKTTSVPTQCVVVDAPDSLYLCGPLMVPTHNSGKYKAANDRFGDDHGDQIRLYVDALEAADGRAPVEGHLYYTGVGRGRKVSLRPADRRKTRRKFVKAWELLNKYQDENAFPANSQVLCGWCPLVNACPVAARDGYGPRLEGLPEKGALGIKTLVALDEVEVFFDINDLALHADESPTDPAEHEPEPFIIPDLDMVSGDYYEDFFVDPELPELEPVLPEVEPPMVDEDTVPADAAPPVEEPDSSADNVTEIGRRSQPSGIDTSESNGQTASSSTDVGASSETAHISSNSNREDDDMLREDKVWEATSADGSLNPNSFAAIAAYGLVELAAETLHEAGIPLKMSTVKALSGTFAHVVETCQEGLTGSTSMQDGANTRMRGALRCTIKTLPLPFGFGEEAWGEWVAKAITRTNAISNAALALWSDGPGESPWIALAVRDASASA